MLLFLVSPCIMFVRPPANSHDAVAFIGTAVSIYAAYLMVHQVATLHGLPLYHPQVKWHPLMHQALGFYCAMAVILPPVFCEDHAYAHSLTSLNAVLINCVIGARAGWTNDYVYDVAFDLALVFVAVWGIVVAHLPGLIDVAEAITVFSCAGAVMVCACRYILNLIQHWRNERG